MRDNNWLKCKVFGKVIIIVVSGKFNMWLMFILIICMNYDLYEIGFCVCSCLSSV